MKTDLQLIRWITLLALSTFNHQFSAFAQGTAFTYQGRLNDDANPANGIYDLRFTVCDAFTNGNVVAGPITNSATAVSGGLFAVTLDFGSGIFTRGGNLWLQVDVRTNGDGTFTTLFPRQPILPVPYAIMANTASNLLGTLSAAQLSGTLPDSVLPAGLTATNANNVFTGTNIFTGPISVNGGGDVLTNSGPNVDTTNLNLSAWVLSQASRISDFQNVGRYSWTNTIALLRAGLPRPLRVLMLGTGISGWPQATLCTNLVNAGFPFVGDLSGTGAFGMGANGNAHGQILGSNWDKYWFGIYVYSTNSSSGDAVWVENIQPWNVCRLTYITAPDAGQFSIITNAPGTSGNWGVVTTLNAYTPTTNTATFYWTNSVTAGYSWGVTNLSGTNRWVVKGEWNTNIVCGILWCDIHSQSAGTVSNLLSVPTNMTAPVFSDLNPDLIIWQDIENATVTNELTHDIAFWRAYCPRADIVLQGIYPFLDSGYTDSNYWASVQDAAYRQTAMNNHTAYFDVFSPFVSTNLMTYYGMTWGANPHIYQAQQPWGYWLFRWLDFQDYY